MKPFLQTWSLSVEEQFYLLFPWIFVLVWSRGKKVLISFLVIISFVSVACMHWGLENDIEANWYLLPGRIWEFVLGAVLALLPERSKEKQQSEIYGQVFSLVGLIILLVSVFTFDGYKPFPSFYTVLPLAGAALIIRFADPSNLVGKILGSKPFVGIGLISYGVFIWHQPLFAFARHYFVGPVKPTVYISLIVMSFFLAYLSWRFVEAPFRNLQFLKRQTFLWGCLIFCFSFIAIGYIGVHKKGFPRRFQIDGIAFNEFFERIRQVKPPAGSLRPIGRLLTHHDLKSRKLKKSLENWNSLVSKDLLFQRPNLAIFGDSFGWDISEALSINGLPVLVLTGSSCILSSDGRNLNDCRTAAEFLREKLRHTPSVKYLAIVQNTISQIKTSFEFWKELNVKLIFVVGRPSFPDFKKILQRGGHPEVVLNSRESEISQQTKRHLMSEKVHLTDANEIFCKITTTCTFKLGGKSQMVPEQILVTDGSHLSPIGKKEFGRVLLEADPLFRKILADSGSQYHNIPYR